MALKPTSSRAIPSIAATVCALFDHLEDVQFWIKDVDGRYHWINRGFLLNYALEHPKDVLGKTDYDLSPAHLADQYTLDDKRVLRGEIILGRVELVGRFDNSASWSVTNKLPVRDAKGKIIGTTGTTRTLSGSAPRADTQESALARAIAMVRQEPSRSWTNRDLAKVTNLSVRAFERHFHSAFNVSPHDFIRRLRVRLACNTLVYTSTTLAQVAEDYGFSDQSHFTREFRRETKLTPGAYRRRYRVSKPTN